MSGRIPQSFIDNLISRIDIVDVIDQRVPLKKAGKNYSACCPFHNEKTPSFSVSADKQFYHCFGCGASGTAITFLMNYENQTFIEALQTLASVAGMELPQVERQAVMLPGFVGEIDPYQLMQQAADFYRRQLANTKIATTAIEYLKQRGLSGEICRDYMIGFAPAGWDNLMQNLACASQQLEAVGLAIQHEERKTYYDRFRNRIMFPIRDRRGRVIAFGGRVLGDDKPKYLNSPESAIFQKGQELYGLYELRQQNRQPQSIIVVEGYMDVVALAQFGIRNAVATLGTAVSAAHLQQLLRVTDRVIFCFDGDSAGRKAAWRGLEQSVPQLQGNAQIDFLFLDEGEDPDSMVRRIGADSFRTFMTDKSVPLSDFLLQEMQRDTDLGAIDGRARLIEKLKAVLTGLPKGSYATLLLEKIAQKLQLTTEGAAEILQRSDLLVYPSRNKRKYFSGQKNAPMPLMRRAIWLCLQFPQAAQEIENPHQFAALRIAGSQLFAELLEFIQQQPNISTAMILEHWRTRPEGIHLHNLLQLPHLLHDSSEGLQQELNGAVNELQQALIQQQHDDLLEKFKQGGLTVEERQQYQQIVQKLKKRHTNDDNR